MITNIKEVQELILNITNARLKTMLQAIGDNAPWDLSLMMAFIDSQMQPGECVKLLTVGLVEKRFYIIDSKGVWYDDENIPDAHWDDKGAMVHLASEFKPTLEAFGMNIRVGTKPEPEDGEVEELLTRRHPMGESEPEPEPEPENETPHRPVIWD